VTAVVERPVATGVLGSTTPRLWTKPLVTGPPGPCGCGCALTPETSLGFEGIAFAEQVLGLKLLPWQRFWLIHAFELRGGRYRFRTILTLVGRQCGKTTLLKAVSLWLMYFGRAELVLGAAQSLEIARESWRGAWNMVRVDPELLAQVSINKGLRRPRQGAGDICLELDPSERVPNGARYRITASANEAGRGLSVDLLILDELRAQRDMGAWAALSKTVSARPNGLIVAISNAGSDVSVVLNSLRETALAKKQDTVGLFEWSADDGAELDDWDAIAQGSPALGYTLSEESVLTSLATDPPAVFRTEIMCQHVRVMDTAIDPNAWNDCLDVTGSLATAKDRVAVCLDVAPDGAHATLVGAALMADGRVRLQLAAYWEPGQHGRAPLEAVRRDLPGLLAAMQPTAVGWFPDSPAAGLGPELRALRLTSRRERVKIVDGRVVEEDEQAADELAGAMDREACQSFAALVAARQVLHDGNELITAHVLAAAKKPSGSGGGWKFVRDTPTGHVDAAYAAAGAAYLARLAPAPQPKPRSRVF
jgi:phage terminase large subunit-like protein